MQMPPPDAQTPLMGCMTGQPEGSVDLAVVERAGIDLRIIETEDAAEGPFQLIAHHGLLVRGGGAQAVEHNDGVGDGGVGIDVVEPDHDAVVLATCGVAGAGAEDGIDDRAVGVIDDAERVVGWPKALRRQAGRIPHCRPRCWSC